jgi:hypothetical protein
MTDSRRSFALRKGGRKFYHGNGLRTSYHSRITEAPEYQSPAGPATAMKVKCGNSAKWIDKHVDVADAIFTRSLPGGADLALRYISGDDTIFHMIELTRPAAK